MKTIQGRAAPMPYAQHSLMSESPIKTTIDRAPATDATAIVKGKESTVISWTENTTLTSLSSNGAGFHLSRPCEPGRLLALMIPMPAHMRSYDQDKKLYRIWGLVQYCYRSDTEGEALYHVGVAFIGKDAPRSYLANPQQCYRVAGIDKRGLWRVEEMDATFKKRRSVRYWESIGASIFLLDSEQQTIAAETVETENISETGASVFATMRAVVGDRIKFVSDQPSFSGLAIVRARRIGSDDRTRIHLEFVDGKFPAAKLADASAKILDVAH
ncbi:MAG: PilZ domain-containing protein [Pyrinomonadaceae bacterium]